MGTVDFLGGVKLKARFSLEPSLWNSRFQQIQFVYYIQKFSNVGLMMTSRCRNM
jgi:hypothetical protein